MSLLLTLALFIVKQSRYQLEMSRSRSVTNNLGSLSEIHAALRPNKIPKPGTPHDQAERAIKLAGSNLLAVGSYNLAQNRHVASKFLVEWPNIWKWVEFLHSECVVEATYGGIIMVSSLFAIGWALKTLATDRPIRNLMSNTSGVLSLIMHHWLKEGTDANMELSHVNGLFAEALYRLLSNEVDMSSVLPNILAAVEGGAETIARVSLEHLSTALNHVPIDLLAINCHLTLINQFAWYDSPPLCAAFYSRKTIVATMNALDIVSASVASDRPQLKEIVIEQCFLTTANVLESTTRGPLEFRRVLDDGFLISFLKSGAQLMHLEKDARGRLIKKIFNFVGRHLVFHSVLGSVAKSLRRIQCLDIDREVAGPIWNAWLEFQGAAEERLLRKKYFDEDEKSATGPGYGCQRQEVSSLLHCSYPLLTFIM